MAQAFLKLKKRQPFLSHQILFLLKLKQNKPFQTSLKQTHTITRQKANVDSPEAGMAESRLG